MRAQESETKGPVIWATLGSAATLGGAAAVALLIWSLAARLDRWEAWQFVVLIYIATLCAITGSILERRARQVQRASWELVSALRGLLWTAVVLALAWVWFPPVERIVGWWMRHVTMFRFG